MPLFGLKNWLRSSTGQNISQHSKKKPKKGCNSLGFFSTYSNTPILVKIYFRMSSHCVSSEGRQMPEEICLEVLSDILSVLWWEKHLIAGFMRTRAELEFHHDKSHQMRNASCELRDAPSFEHPYCHLYSISVIARQMERLLCRGWAVLMEAVVEEQRTHRHLQRRFPLSYLIANNQ